MGVFTDYLASSKMISNADDAKGADRIAKIQINRVKELTGDPDYTTPMAARDEVQSITPITGLDSGNYTITVTHQDGKTATTAAIAHDANAATIEAAIDTACNGTLTNFVDGDISVSGGVLSTNAVVILFDGDSVTSLRHPAVSVNTANTLVLASPGPTQETLKGSAGVDEVQELAVWTGSVTGGNFTLTFTLEDGDFTTAAISYDANSTTIQTAIDVAATSANYPAWTNGDITVSGGILSANAVVFTFDGDSVDEKDGHSLTTIDGANLTGGGSAGAITVTTPGVAPVNEIQTIPVGDALTAGNYTLTVEMSDAETATTAAIDFDANAATIEAALDTACNGVLTGWVDGDISVSGGPLSTADVVLTFDGVSTYGEEMNVTMVGDTNLRAVGATSTSIVAYGQAPRRAWSVMLQCGLVTGTPPVQGATTGWTVVPYPNNRPFRPSPDVAKLLAKDAAIEDGNIAIYNALLEDLNIN